jgi:large subunit ribosomal protein L32
MAVPKKKQSKTRRNKRRANHDKISAPNVILCPQCGEPKLPHRVCENCGTYNDRQVVIDIPEE